MCPYAWDVPGGVQRHVADLAQALMAIGHEVSVIAPTDDGPEHGRDCGLPPYVVPAGRAVPVPYNGSVARVAFGFVPVARVRRWLREGEFDILHVHEPMVPSLSLLACWAARGPIVATFHTCNTRSRALAAAYPVLQTALEKIGGRIVVSEVARRTLTEHVGGDAVLVPNGVAVDRFDRAGPLAGWPADGGALGFLGRMDDTRKGLPVLLDAFRLLVGARPGLRLLIAGPGNTARVRSYLPRELWPRVEVAGQVSEQDKVRMLHSVSVFCAPNLGGESFGVVLAEAMASGAAIVASDIDAFRRVLDAGEAGALFRTGDPRDLARVAGGLLDDPARRGELAQAARAAVGAYDWSVVARDVVRVYETVILATACAVEESPCRHF